MFYLDEEKRWFTGARRVDSPNYDARPDDSDIDLVVIHGISLPPGCYGGPYIDHLFTNCLNADEHEYFAGIRDLRVSSHLLIDRRGDLTQYVPLDRRAWHAGDSRFGDRSCCNDFSIGIELEGCDHEDYDPRQYASLAGVIASLQKQWPAITRERIVGHCDIAPGRKTDPGEAFDWEYFSSLLV